MKLSMINELILIRLHILLQETRNHEIHVLYQRPTRKL